ncbi:MAG: GNAT family N-acetyltransferase [Sphingobacteriaceae bacterium]|nr:GNAT family N-acetyltransferase [Sphingobacteriaceae bacterium]
MITLKRCDSSDKDFGDLIKELDKVLWSRYSDIQQQYDSFNKVDSIKNVVVAYINNSPVGCGAFKKFDGDTVEIKRMFVAEDNRGKGVALAILNELELWAVELNYNHAVLETGRRLAEAMGLYTKQNYFITENYGQYIGMENSVCMKKSLRLEN